MKDKKAIIVLILTALLTMKKPNQTKEKVPYSIISKEEQGLWPISVKQPLHIIVNMWSGLKTY